ncbi:hypothetical protein [Pedobacter westerhofensis]|nr:hypothetical protein [Pedobacter westerhofensis]
MAFLLIIVFSNSCKKSSQLETDIATDVPKNERKVMTEPLKQVCVETWWVSENWVGDQLISTSRDLMYSVCFTPSQSSNSGGLIIASPVKVDIKPDSLKKNFPCVYSMLLDLSHYPAVNELLLPFITETAGAPGVNPKLYWFDSTSLAWTPTGQSGVTVFGKTVPGFQNESLSSAIYLNRQMLIQSSPALIQSIMVHEMIHAYLNTVRQFAAYGIINDESKPLLERLSYFAKKSADDNGRDHLTILASYIDKIALAVQSTDISPRNKSLQDYYKLAIGSLYTDGNVPSPDFKPTFETLLNSINSANNFTITIENAAAKVVSEKKVPAPYTTKCLN